MSEETFRLLENRVLEAVARIRHLRSERDRRGEECAALRVRLEDLDRGGTCDRREEKETDLENVRAALREAIRELREEDETAAQSGTRRDLGWGE